MVAVESKIILIFFAEKGPYNMTMGSVVPLIVTDTNEQTTKKTKAINISYIYTYLM